MTGDFSLYFHIPFCTKKCDYCHFYVLPNNPSYHRLLIEGLSLDLNQWAPHFQDKELASIYFGGGTPSLLGAEPLAKILEKVHSFLPFERKNIEITLEANPETISLPLMREYAEAGVNRVSIGIQSLDDRLLQKLGRSHHASRALEAIENTASAGISNISIDLMYDIPLQTVASWEHSLQYIAHLPITHLSLYNLTIEPHTVFFKYKESLQKELPDAESSAQMYQAAVTILAACGLQQYEISAFARNGLSSKHNLGYWTGRPFLGLGPSAFSYWEGKRFRAIANLNRYVQALRKGESPIDFSEQLSPLQHRRELLTIALRILSGVDLENFQARHSPLDEEVKMILRRLSDEGLITWQQNHIALTNRGVLFYDSVAVELI